MSLFATLIDSAANHPHEKRRGRILVTLCLGVIGMLLSVGTALTLLQPSPGRFINLGLAILVFTIAGVLGRKGYVTAGAYVVIGASGIGSLSGVFLNPTSPFNIFYLIIGVLLASVLLPPRQIWIVLGLCLVSIVGVMATIPSEIQATINLGLAAAHLTVLLTVSAFISFIGARSLTAALETADIARKQAETISQQLSAANATLESRVEERTEALQKIADEQRAVVERLEESLKAQQLLYQTVLNMAVPVIPVSDDALVVPLIGIIDNERMHHLLHSALQSIEQTRARVLIVDVTGAAVIDSHVAAALLRVAQSARLMGTETILAGIRPEVAQALVGLGANLDNLRTTATLQSALMLIGNNGVGRKSRVSNPFGGRSYSA